MLINEIISKKPKVIYEKTDGGNYIAPDETLRDFRLVRVQKDLKDIGLDEKGVFLFRDSSHAGKRRNTIHFTKNYPVASHMWGNWDNSLVVIIADPKQIVAPMQGYNPEDSWYQVGEGGKLYLGKDAVIMMPDGMDAKATWQVQGKYGSLPIIRYSGSSMEARNKAVDEYVKSKVDQEYRNRSEYGIDDETSQDNDHQDTWEHKMEEFFDYFQKLFKELTEIEEKIKNREFNYRDGSKTISSTDWTIEKILEYINDWKKYQPKNFQRASDSGYIDRILDKVNKLQKKVTPIKKYVEQAEEAEDQARQERQKKNTPPPIPDDRLPQQIYLAIKGVTSGPFAPQIIKQKIKSGQVDINNAHVWWDGLPNWQRASDYTWIK